MFSIILAACPTDCLPPPLAGTHPTLDPLLVLAVSLRKKLWVRLSLSNISLLHCYAYFASEHVSEADDMSDFIVDDLTEEPETFAQRPRALVAVKGIIMIIIISIVITCHFFL
jgi:hypothetical protein